MSTKRSTKSAQSVETVEAVAVDTAPVLALVEAARTAWAESIGTEQSATERCAVAAFEASPFIGKGLLFEDVDAFRALFPNRNGDGAVSKSTVTLWKRLGKCHSLGITPETERQVWTRVQSKGNSDARMRSAIDDPKASKTKVTRAVNGCYVKGVYTKQVKPVTAGSESATGEGNGETTAAEKVTVPASVSAMLDTLETIAARLASEPITPAEFARLADVVETLSGLTASDVDTVEASRKTA